METRKTASLIDRLTSDNDERQELWVRYLENSDVSALCVHLAKIRKIHSEEQLLQVTLWRQVYNKADLKLLNLFDHFTDLEQAVMRLLALGATVEEISGIKDIPNIRVRHIISVIRENPCWKKNDGT